MSPGPGLVQRRWLVGASVLLLHLLLAGLLGRTLLGTSPGRPGPQSQRITFWLAPLPAQPQPSPTMPEPRRRPQAQAEASTPRALPTPSHDAATTEPSQAPVPYSPTAAATTPAPEPEPSRSTLNLSLPSQGPLRHPTLPPGNPALADARSHTRPSTLEQRMAQVFGTDGAPEEERVSDTVRIFRKNGKCFVAEQSRAAQLFAIDQSSRNIPWGLRPCK